MISRSMVIHGAGDIAFPIRPSRKRSAVTSRNSSDAEPRKLVLVSKLPVMICSLCHSQLPSVFRSANLAGSHGDQSWSRHLFQRRNASAYLHLGSLQQWQLQFIKLIEFNLM